MAKLKAVETKEDPWDKLERVETVRKQRYRQAYQQHRQWEAHVASLRALVPQALKVLSEALEDTADPKQRAGVALAIVRMAGLGALDPPRKPSYILQQCEEIEPDLEPPAAPPNGDR
ncbi:MAG TPA: hypothetical protein PKX69_10715 [Limnochordia bacterium]|nr:hypothetical protein [Limnochordia bacterium]